MMAWAIFHREVNFRRPRGVYSFNVQPSPKQQSRPKDLVDYAVSKGWATEVPAPTRSKAKARKSNKGAE